MISSLRQLGFLALACLVVASPSLSAFEDLHSADDAPTAVDFSTQILPILQRRCIECHNSTVTEAGLNLESRALAESGGHTGNTILGNDPEQSELVQRIISDDSTYRMPKDKSPLSQAEIDIFQTWIREGANWPDAPPAGDSSFRGAIVRGFHRIVDPFWTALQRDGKYLRFLGFPLVAFLLFILIAERIKKAQARRRPDRETTATTTTQKGLERIGILHYFAGLIFIAIIGLGLYHLGSTQNSKARIENLEIEIASLLGEQANSGRGEDGVRPHPPRRRHPKRLGGTYYRGNDERDPKLYNGGFYQTAELEVWLSDAEGRRLKWDDPVTSESLFVTMQISRAPIATSALFTPRVISKIFMSRQVLDENADELKDTPVGFIPVVEGERFIAHYSITDSANSAPESLKGMVYVYQGALDGSRVTGKIHYGIEYDVVIENGRISSESQVWMGSIFNLGRALVIPADDRIALSEWFDFRPIPVIQGKNTTDPKLLGIPEHVPGDY